MTPWQVQAVVWPGLLLGPYDLADFMVLELPVMIMTNHKKRIMTLTLWSLKQGHVICGRKITWHLAFYWAWHWPWDTIYGWKGPLRSENCQTHQFFVKWKYLICGEEVEPEGISSNLSGRILLLCSTTVTSVLLLSSHPQLATWSHLLTSWLRRKMLHRVHSSICEYMLKTD
jgi:hypothetical protein